MKRYCRNKYKKKVSKKQNLFDIVSPIIIVCFACFLVLSLLTGFNTLAIIFLAFIFALIPNAYSLYQTYKKRQKYINMEIPEIDNLTGFEFEELLRRIL